mgnify:CR=1 FL=1
MDGDVDAIVCGVGTGGTITGIGKYFEKNNPKTEMVLADPEGSIVKDAVEKKPEVENQNEGNIKLSRAPSKRYKIQEVIKVRQILLVQVTKEERGNKGADLTSYLTLAGRNCVLMPSRLHER